MCIKIHGLWPFSSMVLPLYTLPLPRSYSSPTHKHSISLQLLCLDKLPPGEHPAQRQRACQQLKSMSIIYVPREAVVSHLYGIQGITNNVSMCLTMLTVLSALAITGITGPIAYGTCQSFSYCTVSQPSVKGTIFHVFLRLSN
jgi:hypothetical protein